MGKNQSPLSHPDAVLTYTGKMDVHDAPKKHHAVLGLILQLLRRTLQSKAEIGGRE